MSNRQKSQAQLSHGSSAAAWADAHQRLREDDSVWANLQFQGISGQAGGPVHEMRACPSCGTTIYRPVSLPDAVSMLSDYCGVVQRSLAMIPALLVVGPGGEGASPHALTD